MKPALFFILICCCINVNAQSVIHAKIIDSISHQPLEGTLIVEKNYFNNKAISDKQGEFSLKLHQQNDSVEISFIGYKFLTTTLSNSSVIKLAQDEIKLEDVVLTQTNIQQKFTAIARIDLDLKPVKNSQELMRIVPGLFVAQHAGGGKAEQIFLRGFDCDHGTDIAVSVDGMPVNMVSHAHGQGYADSHFIIPETVNAIDYGTGPYYAQQGNLNTAGYVNFSTYNNITQSKILLEAGQFDTYRTLAMIDLLKKNKDKQSAYIAADFNYTNGPTNNPQNFNRFNVFGKYNLAISDNTQITASLSAFKSKWDASGQIPTRAVEQGIINRFGSIDPSEGGHTSRYNFNLSLNHHFNNDLNWYNQLYYSRYIFSLYSDFTFYLTDPVNGDEIHQAEKRKLFGYISKIEQAHVFNSWSLHSNYAVGLRYDATDSAMLAHVAKRQFLNYTKLGNINEANAYAYVQQTINAGKWLIDAGVRFDVFNFKYHDLLSTQQQPSQTKSIISPKLNIQYAVNNNLQLYVKFGKGFHSNDARVVVEEHGHEILPAAYGSDVGVIIKPVNNLIINVAAWYLYLQQEFVYAGDDGNIEPGGKTVRKGLDFIVRYQLVKNIFVNANVNLTKPKALDAPKGEDYIPLAPTFTSTGGIYYKTKYGINGGISFRYIKDRPANEDNSIIAKGYFVTDASVNYKTPKCEIGIAIDNVFNTNWNEAQFATESRLYDEPAPVTELNFTPGNPFMIRARLSVFF
ncbi:MAG: TonB-dependent receptor plug domain-containing protein [Parafilimonas sp.]|nr:TonB-dependent receptor plug domain-containing protein [Parafilimonas sp.]